MTDYYYDDVTGKPFKVVPYKDLVNDDIVKNEIDIDYYKKVIETQNDPEILKGELTDLVAEVADRTGFGRERTHKRKDFICMLRKHGLWPNGAIERDCDTDDIVISFYKEKNSGINFISCKQGDALLIARRINEFLDGGG